MTAAAAETAPLDFLELEVTGLCNLSCTHCYASIAMRRANTAD